MPNLDNSTNWSKTFTISKQNNTKVSLDTDGKYVEKDIDLTFNVQSASTLNFTGGGLNNQAADLSTQTNVTTNTSTNNSGVSITCRGKAGRAAVTYTNTTGGWFDAHSSATTASSAVSQQTWAGTTYYIDGVTLQKPSSGTRTFDITVPNGASDTITFHFVVDSSGNTTIEEPSS